jgi:GNAT superfamily N-acetyltransferase
MFGDTWTSMPPRTELDFGAAKDLIGTSSFWANHFPVIGAVGRHASGDRASVLMTDCCRYVGLVATDPAWQRRGLADAAMRRALALSAAVHGERPTLLRATEAGRPVYERMGYRTISHHASSWRNGSSPSTDGQPRRSVVDRGRSSASARVVR